MGFEVSFDSARSHKYDFNIDPEEFYILSEVRDKDMLCKKHYSSTLKYLRNVTEGRWVRAIKLSQNDLKDMGIFDNIHKKVCAQNRAYREKGGGRFPTTFVKGEDILKYLHNNLDEGLIATLRARNRTRDLFYAQTGAINF